MANVPPADRSTLRKLTATANSSAGNGDDHGLAPEVRFLRRAIRLLHLRAAANNGDANEGGLAIFILSPAKPDVEVAIQRIPILSAKVPFGGQVWWTNEAITFGYQAELLGNDADDYNRLEGWGYGKFPAVVFDPSSPEEEIRYYPSGIESAPLEPRAFNASGASREAIERGMEALRIGVFTRPGLAERSASPWRDAGRHYVKSDAESVMQSHVQTALAFHFHTCRVSTEENVLHGRLDVLLEEYVESIHAWRAHCVLELKVLRDFNESGAAIAVSTNRNAVTKGTLQAVKYRQDTKATWSALYCFDFRVEDKGDEFTFSHITTRAAGWEVQLCRWYVAASADLARQIDAPATA